MSFVRTARRRRPEWLDEWEEVDPLRNGCRCPECGATCHGREARAQHREGHRQDAEFLEQLLAAVHYLGRQLGVTFDEPGSRGAGLDQRLTAKARQVAQIDYDDEEYDDGV